MKGTIVIIIVAAGLVIGINFLFFNKFTPIKMSGNDERLKSH